MSAPTAAKNVFRCDVCGADDAAEIDVARAYTGDQPIHVCRQCGFVYVRERRSAEAIAASWSDEIFGDGYSARIPAVVARQVYVAEYLATEVGLNGKSLCDIGGGEGQFLEIVRKDDYGATPFGIEPSAANCAAMCANQIDCFEGTLEDYLASSEKKQGFDIVTTMWTLENCQDCNTLIAGAHDLLKDGGHLCIATGSRLLVPFKKPLDLYLSDNPADTHSFRFSANTLRRLMAKHGLQPIRINRYIDTDVLCVIAEKTGDASAEDWPGDDWRQVIDFFNRWDRETRDHYPPERLATA